jgi:uncharacterized protein (DUF1778 family)
MTGKSEYLQIRVTPAQKSLLKRRAAAAGLDVSSYVLSRALPTAQSRFEELVRGLAEASTETRYILAELNDHLAATGSAGLMGVVADTEMSRLTPFLQNYVAAMVEHAAWQKGVRPPPWTADVVPLDEPHFAAPLKGLRLHLLKCAPVAYKRRNIFVDAAVGARV